VEAGRAEHPDRPWRRAARSSPPGHGGGRAELPVWGLAVAHGGGADGSRLSRAPSTPRRRRSAGPSLMQSSCMSYMVFVFFN
jgi:hypothetical protein